MKKLSFLLLAAFYFTLLSCTPKVTGTAREGAMSDSLSFIVIGDWGVGGSPAQRRVAEQIDQVSR